MIIRIASTKGKEVGTMEPGLILVVILVVIIGFPLLSIILGFTVKVAGCLLLLAVFLVALFLCLTTNLLWDALAEILQLISPM